jgi:hypothetical protein
LDLVRYQQQTLVDTVMDLTEFGCAYTEITFKFSHKPQTEYLVLIHRQKNVTVCLSSSDSTVLPPKRSRKFSE